MKTTKTLVQLSNPNNLEIVNKVFSVMGDTIYSITDDFGDDDVDTYYEFVKNDNPASIGFLGDNAIGACNGLYMEGDTLVGIFNFGDDGDIEIDINDGTSLILLSDL